MQLSLRPYATAGLAIAGASIIAVAPLQPIPTDIAVPNPAVVRDVQLTGFIDDTVNELLFQLVASPTVRISEALLVPLAEALGVDEELAASLPLASLGIVGPIISGGGATGLAFQNLIDSLGDDNPLEAFTLALINGPALMIDGTVNGGYGPDLASLVIPFLPALPATIPVGTFNLVTQKPEACVPGPTCLVLTVVPSYGSIFAPGLLTPLGPIPPATELITAPTITVVGGVPTVVPGKLSILPTLPGTFPVLTTLTEALFGLLNPPEEMATTTLSSAEKSSINNVDPANEQNLVTLDAAPDLDGPRGKHAAPDTTLGAPLRELPDLAGDTAKQVAEALKLPKTQGSDFGKNVAGAAKPDRAPGGTTVVRDSLVFTPPTGDKSDAAKGGTHPGAGISAIAKKIGDAVKGALGGSTTSDDSEE